MGFIAVVVLLPEAECEECEECEYGEMGGARCGLKKERA